jgi:predicted secreted protein with PEFG-CTERM motif
MSNQSFSYTLLLAAFALGGIFLTPAFGQQEIHRIYADPLPDWAGFAQNVIYDSTTAWSKANPDIKFYKSSTLQGSDIQVRWVKEFVGERLGTTIDRHHIEMGLGDSKCNDKWQPFSVNTLDRIMEHEIGHALGLPHSSDPNSIMYPIQQNMQYGQIEKEFTLTSNYDQFVSLCAANDITSYDYTVSTDDPTYGFDVYFVPSVNEYNNYAAGKEFSYYSGDGCSAKNYLEYSGTCSGVAKRGGLLIVMPEKLINPLVKVTVKLQEGDAYASESQLVQSSSAMQPTNALPEGDVSVSSNTITNFYPFYPIYSIVGGNVLGIKADTQLKSLIVSIQTTGDGQLTIDLPRALIDAKTNDQTDDQFFVTNDGYEAQFTEIPTTTNRTLIIPFIDGTEQIKIIGTQIMPEFGTTVTLVLAISVIGIIVVSKKITHHSL